MQLPPLVSTRTFPDFRRNLVLASSHSPSSPRTPFPSMDESGLDTSHTWTHSPCGLLCLIPSLSVVGSESVPGAARVGVLLLLVVEGRSQGCVLECVYPLIGGWTSGSCHSSCRERTAEHGCVQISVGTGVFSSPGDRLFLALSVFFDCF